MLRKIFIAAALPFAFSTAAFAAGPHYNPNGGAYHATQDRGVTVMRGNMPSIRNPQNTLIAQRQAAEKRADMAERRAIMANRRAENARAALAARPATRPVYNGYRPRSSSPYYSGNYRFGASVSRPGRLGHRGFQGRRGFGGKRAGAGRRSISRPVFTRRIRG